MDLATAVDSVARWCASTNEPTRSLADFPSEWSTSQLADQERFVIGDRWWVDLTIAIISPPVVIVALMILFSLYEALAFPLVAACIWGAAEVFTRERRLIFTSFLLCKGFVVCWTASCFALALVVTQIDVEALLSSKVTATAIPPVLGVLTAAGGAIGCLIYWLRFAVPVAYVLAVTAGFVFCWQVLRFLIPDASTSLANSVLLCSGILTFILAMWWDVADPQRRTRRSDIAFWLHTLAGGEIAAASFQTLIGYSNTTGWHRTNAVEIAQFSATSAVLTLLLSVIFYLISLLIDRRPLLFSSLVFALPATVFMLAGLGALAAWIAFGMVGVALVIALWRWKSLRRALLPLLPDRIRARLPVAQ